ncbi:ubiquitin-related domain-containing protein [Zopfochytrium polystomum]|nr:ubiquitin-related domain-containing protein [Zopfochytrium polystomum]
METPKPKKKVLSQLNRLLFGLPHRIVSFLPIPYFQRTRAARRAAAATRRRQQSASSNDPQAAAARFLLSYEQLYGTEHPQFFLGTYSQALDVAKRELRYLFVILHSPDHDDTDVGFHRETLGSERLLTYLREKNFLVWAGDVRESESFLVSNVLLATRYPFTAIIAPQGSRMVVVDRIEGLVSPDALVGILTRQTARVDPVIQALRTDRYASHEQARQIREQQDLAYQASLRADQEKEAKAREERERIQREKDEEERLKRQEEERIEAKKKRKQALRESLPPEPAATEPELARIGIRLPSGSRIIRRFRASDKVEALYDFVESLDLDPIPIASDIVIAKSFPRKVLSDRYATMRESGLFPNETVVVEEDI